MRDEVRVKMERGQQRTKNAACQPSSIDRPRQRSRTLATLIAAAVAIGVLLQNVSSPEGPLAGRIVLGVVVCLFVLSRKSKEP